MSWITSMTVKTMALAGLLVAGLAALAVDASAEPPQRGDMVKFVPASEDRSAPDTPFISADGEPIKLDSYRGKTVLVNFWATWCPPCVKELPSLDRLNAELADKNFEVVLVSIDRGGARVFEPFLEKLGIRELRSSADSKAALMRAFKAPGLPTTYLIGPDGTIKGRLVGDAEWDSAAAKELIMYYTSNS
ncbi:TlpA family protein disulfide reductase [Nisaea acidiphila]|uniref:TlpA family protein disulfide reductase n=1 Tax=Nisaea acidiphila TaxID=1862145 RepID=A0A9J7AS80_9PROT|nr:TlpA disulfide reductase family protein [Nisaea acidiphila]UUX48173.1 TlpA family protein disulfide reductase [Nisaea acidiphila]